MNEERTRGVAVLAILSSLLVVLVAERDLAGRPAGRVRGPRLLWRIAATNALGALAYLRWGRVDG